MTAALQSEDLAGEHRKTLPLVSVIIPVFKQETLLMDCLKALAEQEYKGPLEIIVVNNGAPGDLDRLSPDFPDVKFVYEPTPGSYNARNTGIAAAAGSILAFTDADCVPEPWWISKGVRSLLASRLCGFVGGQVRLVPRDSAKPSLGELHDITFGFRQKNYVERGRFAVTANMLTRRDVVDAVGGFRGDLRSGGDAEWGKRVFAAGYLPAYDEEAAVCHPARDFRDLMQKMRRTAAGERDRNPDWASCLSQCLRRLLLPPQSIRMIFRGVNAPLATSRKLLLIATATLIRWQYAFERLKLQLTSGESPRS